MCSDAKSKCLFSQLSLLACDCMCAQITGLAQLGALLVTSMWALRMSLLSFCQFYEGAPMWLLKGLT